MSVMSIEVRNVRKTFGDQVGLQDVSIAAPTGKLVALLGPSGSGKTTLLRIIGALDAMVRKDLRRWLRELQDQLQVTTVLVTHDREEALEVADAIVVMNNGRVEQEGSPDHVYANPGTPFVYRFLGGVNLFHGRL